MNTHDIDQIANEILIDMFNREKGVVSHPEPSVAPNLKDAFETLIQEEDETGKLFLSKIWKELQ